MQRDANTWEMEAGGPEAILSYNASSRPAWSAQRPFLRKGMGCMGCVHGTEYMGCIPRETEAWKSLKLRSLRPAWVEQESIPGGKKKGVYPYKYTCLKKEKRQKKWICLGQDFDWSIIFSDSECSDINLSLKRRFIE